jgi:hypothetical protein
MRSIGFRAAPTQVTYAIVEGDGSTFTIITLGNLPVPAALLPPNQLHFLRTVLLDVMRAFQIVRAGLRLPEMTPGGADSFRTNAAYSGGIRPLIPVESGHPFRRNPATCSG